MSIRIRIAPSWQSRSWFVRALVRPGYFERHGETLHDGRNRVKRFEVDGCLLAVKSYVRLSIINRFFYGFIRRSKAERAYRHAIRLRSAGIDTPEGVAFVEIRRGWLLRASYFVSVCSSYRPVRPVTERFSPGAASCVVLDALAAFLFRMHEAGVLHKDLNIGNLLYEEDGRGGYRFQVIDTNRMKFQRRLSVRRRLDNLRRLSCPVPAYLYILDRYAGYIRSNASTLQLRGTLRRLLFEWRQRMKRRMKSWL